MNLRQFFRKARKSADEIWGRFRVSSDVRHVYGAISISTKPDDVVIVCVVKNGSAYIDNFVKHYRQIGARHIFILDNRSTDDSVEMFSKYDCVSIWKCGLPYKLFKNAMKDFLADRFGGACWVLCVDIDELFRFPGDDRVSLTDLVSYLSDHDHEALVAHMIDMFPDGALQASGDADWSETHCWFDIDSLEAQDYGAWYGAGNKVSNPAIPYYLGGSRAKAFGARQWLSKHPLFNARKGIRISHSHHVFGANIADISGILLHYKYVGDFQEYFKMVVADGSFWNGSSYYRQYLETLEKNPQMSLMTPTSVKFESLDSLEDMGIMCISDTYRTFLADYPPKTQG